MSVTITIDLGNITRPEVLAVQKLLTDFDSLAMQERISNGDFTDETIEAAALRLAGKEAERRPIRSQLPVAVDLSAPGRVDEKEETPTNDAATDAAMDLVQEKAPANGPETPKAKRGRPKKEVAAEQVDPTQAPETSPASSAAPEPEAVAIAPSLDTLRSALMAYTDKRDVEAGMNLLHEFGVNRVSELTGLAAGKQVEFLSKCEV